MDAEHLGRLGTPSFLFLLLLKLCPTKIAFVTKKKKHQATFYKSQLHVCENIRDMIVRWVNYTIV